MLAGSSSLRSIVFVSVILVATLAFTGVASSAYHKQRRQLAAMHYERGLWSARHGEVDDAIDQYRDALLFLPDLEIYRLSLAIALLNANHLAEAEAHLEQLADADPNNGRIYLALAHVAEKRGNVKAAIDRCQRAVYQYWPPESIPERRRARWELVRLLDQSGRGSEAVGELIQLYASSPPDAAERAHVGFALLQHGAASEASRVFRDLTVAGPQNSQAHKGLGEAYFAVGDYVSARHEFQRAARLELKDQSIQDDLTLANAVIDLDPLLPGINFSERLRRSRNVLTRVVHYISSCSPGVAPNATSGADLDAANKLLEPQSNAQDLPETTQQVAVRLWGERSLFCRSQQVSDRPLEIAIARIAGE